VNVGKIKGNSKVYPQLRLPSQYAGFAGKKASVYEMKGGTDDTTFVIRFDAEGQDTGSLEVQESEKTSKTSDNFKCLKKPFRGSDSG